MPFNIIKHKNERERVRYQARDAFREQINELVSRQRERAPAARQELT